MSALTSNSLFRGIAAALLATASVPAYSCPFCAAESRTLTEEIGDSSAVVLAKLAEPSPMVEDPADAGVPYGFIDPETGSARFEVQEVLLGEEAIRGEETIEVIYFGEPDKERMFFVRGVGLPPEWTIPLPLSDEAVPYVRELFRLPEGGADRLAFFQEYLEHPDPLLGQDAYDEFARAPYADVIDLAPRMDREQLLAWIEGGRVSPSRRRLFMTMLGVCGQPEDVARIEKLLSSDIREIGPSAKAVAAASLGASPGLGGLGAAVVPEAIRFGERSRKLGLDAMIACYLTLSGRHGDVESALRLIEDRFLKDTKAEYSHVHAALMAVRFLAEEQQDLVPLERVVQSARLLLDHPDFADQVIPDLARWEDWDVIDRMVLLFEQSFDEDANQYVREPVITYLDVAAEQGGPVGDKAVLALERVESLDPDAAKRARRLQAFGFLAQARAPRGDANPAIIAEGAPQAADSEIPPTPTEFEVSPEERARKQAEENAQIVARVRDARSGFANALSREAEAVAEINAAPAGLLVGIPLLGALVCMGAFWVILRGGSA